MWQSGLLFWCSGSQAVGHGNILRWATELFKKLLDLLKNSVSFVSLWLSLLFCVCLVVLTVVASNDAAVFLLQRDSFHSNYSINSVQFRGKIVKLI